ncbi:DMT family transporter [Solirhodobacter olei]|uniref:DMT family transporter n=1 Tax=Solirhodobacter olei TaxID=2493082 RepID=UPI000FDB12BE|nr:DMT family transporter [Solirhodobacter olei]
MSMRAAALLSVLGFFWGANFLFMKLAVVRIPALDVAMWRTACGAVPIVALAFWRRRILWRDLSHWPHFLAMALLASLGPYVLFVMGTEHLPSGVAGAIAGSVPCITAAIAAVTLPSERPTRATVLGLVLGLAGILLLSPLGGDQSAGRLEWAGVLSMLGGALSYALALVYARRFVQPLGLGSNRLAAWQMIFALALLLPLSRPGSIDTLAQFPSALAGLVLGLGFLGTGAAFVIYYELISELGALRAGTVYYIPPAVALLLGAAFLGEPLDLREGLGTCLILIGVFYASGKRSKVGHRSDRLRLHQSEDGGARDRAAL